MEDRAYGEEEGQRMKTGRAEAERRQAMDREGESGQFQSFIRTAVRRSPGTALATAPERRGDQSSRGGDPLLGLHPSRHPLQRRRLALRGAGGGRGAVLSLLPLLFVPDGGWRCSTSSSARRAAVQRAALRRRPPPQLHGGGGQHRLPPVVRHLPAPAGRWGDGRPQPPLLPPPRVRGGDCASVSIPSNPTFLQMRLWSQALMQGSNAAATMYEDAIATAIGGGVSEAEWTELAAEQSAELYFAPFFHETRLMGERLILMGLFNERQHAWKTEERRHWRAARRKQKEESREEGTTTKRAQQPQRHRPLVSPQALSTEEADGEEEEDVEEEELAEECQVLMRVLPHSTSSPVFSGGAVERGHYVKVVQAGGRVVGCTLIGETDLEEVLENLITNQLNVHMLGDDWLHADVDLQDFFD